MVWLHRLPGPIAASLVVIVVMALTIAGLLLTRAYLRAAAQSHNELAGYIITVIGAFYGVLLALVAVEAMAREAAVELATAKEASSLWELYRHVQGYPQPVRGTLQQDIQAYARHVVDTEWPSLQRGERQTYDHATLDRLISDLVTFAPQSLAEQTLHRASLDRLDEMLEQRHFRLHEGQRGLLPVLWAVLVAGAVITIGFTYFFVAESLRMHALMTACLAALIGLSFYLIMDLSHPLWGRLGGTTVDHFRLVKSVIEQPKQ